MAEYPFTAVIHGAGDEVSSVRSCSILTVNRKDREVASTKRSEAGSIIALSAKPVEVADLYSLFNQASRKR
jgi:hypothetical protein